ncbi:MAG: hypothetical protein PHH16_00430 [Candidatus Gracilibacteria bacterium]|nr:hypothetical protein [Candidatus Gracilibacteria bacterium]
MKTNPGKHYWIWLAGGTLIVASVFWATTSDTGLSKKSSREIALACTNDTATQFHIHADLEIIDNGAAFDIPENIGIHPGCMNAIHTHEEKGKIHVESPIEKDFTLGDFFAVWGRPFSKDRLLDSKADATHSIRVTVNGREVDTFENTVLKDDEIIRIVYEKR